jgi:hypothetical protein
MPKIEKGRMTQSRIKIIKRMKKKNPITAIIEVA